MKIHEASVRYDDMGPAFSTWFNCPQAAVDFYNERSACRVEETTPCRVWRVDEKVTHQAA